MKTRALSNTVLGLGLIATFLLFWTAFNGYSVTGEEGLRDHLLVALLAVFLLTLAHGWIVLFLLASGWAIEKTFGNLLEETARAVRSVRWGVVPFALLALLLAIVNFGLGGQTFTGKLSSSTHRWISWLTLAVQIAALVVEHRGLRRYGELLAEIEQQAGRADRDTVQTTVSRAR